MTTATAARGTGAFVDLRSWKRREHFELFRGASHPFFSVTVELDVTNVRNACSGPGHPSFFLLTVYCALQAANETEAFRLRIRGDRVWLHDRVLMSSTILREDDTFGFGRFELSPSLPEFLAAAGAEVRRVRAVQPLELPCRGEDDLVYHSSLPWFRFTAFTNAINLGSDSVPRLVFGRCVAEGGTWQMPVSVEVHHALVDGLDVARFLERLATRFSELGP